ncbi:MAG: DUF2203 family protein, partial [Thermomicrobiaceae bacterium]|nr:DUF2203 family protein [Thermomicrobiaceae bacterium]
MAAEEPRLFTVAEARALVPRLRALLTALQAEQQQLDATMRALEGLTPAMRGNGSAQEASRLELRLGELADAIQRRLEEIARLGVEVKDIGLG